MCKGEAHVDFELRTMPAILKVLILQFQVFPDPGEGLCKNWGMTARVNVMFYPMG
jgi:hypothetical protein